MKHSYDHPVTVASNRLLPLSMKHLQSKLPPDQENYLLMKITHDSSKKCFQGSINGGFKFCGGTKFRYPLSTSILPLVDLFYLISDGTLEPQFENYGLQILGLSYPDVWMSRKSFKILKKSEWSF